MQSDIMREALASIFLAASIGGFIVAAVIVTLAIALRKELGFAKRP